MSLDFPAPNLLGAPQKYERWRNQQPEAVLRMIDSPKRFVGIGAPTGFGKSLVYTVASLLSGRRTVILTSTKALQSQLYTDFAESGMVEIKGLNAYECIEGRPTGRFGDVPREGWRADNGLPMACDEAPCQSGAFCPRREGGCLYYDAYRTAGSPKSRIVVTNYAYWMSINKWSEEKLGPVDNLVLDEAHSALDELGGFVGTELKQSEVETVLPSPDGRPALLDTNATLEDWVDWGQYYLARANLELELIKEAIRESERSGTNRYGHQLNMSSLRRARDLRRLSSKLAIIAGMNGEWIIDWQEDSHRRPVVKFDPVWPGEYAESHLFLNVPKVVLVSATIRPETADMLNINRADLDFKEYLSSFPVKNRPIIFVPTGKMSRSSEKETMKVLPDRVDQIIGRRLDRKGIIQTVSYSRARDIYYSSSYRHLMLQHSPNETRDTIEQFKRAKAPCVLVSPVLSTGYDFPYDQAEYQILVKMPFPVSTDKIVQARTRHNEKYKDIITATELIQMAGRIVRADDDTGETFILDSDFQWWFFNRKFGNKVLCPRWFIEAVRTDQTLGVPLPKIRRKA